MKFLLLILILNISALSFSQYNFQWYRTYDHPYGFSYYDEAYDMTQDNEGNIYVTGVSFGEGDDSRYDIATIKYNSNGDSLWVRRFNGGVNSFDAPAAIHTDNQQNIIISGISILDMLTIKYDQSGNLLWSKKFSDTAYDYRHEAFNMEIDAAGNIYVVGYSNSYNAGSAAQIIKYDPNGEFLWKGKYESNSIFGTYFTSVTFDNNNGVIAAGTSQSDFIIVKYDVSGNEIWVTRTNIYNSEFPSSVISDNAGNIYVSGYGTDPGEVKEMILLKYNSNGILLWTKKYKGVYLNNSEQFLAKPNMLAMDSNENVIVNFNSYNQYNIYETATAKYNPNGDLIWINKYSADEDSSYQETRDLKITPGGNIFVTAVSRKYFVSDFNTFVILCYENDGTLKKEIRGDNQFENEFFPMKSEITIDGSVHTTGYSINNFHVTDYFTMKHSLSVGINSNINSIPSEFKLHQNYPNPFNPKTIINYELGITNYVSIKVYDVLGNEIAELVNERQNAGSYKIEFDGSNFASGVYFYKLTAGDFSETKRMVLIR